MHLKDTIHLTRNGKTFIVDVSTITPESNPFLIRGPETCVFWPGGNEVVNYPAPDEVEKGHLEIIQAIESGKLTPWIK